MQRILRTLFPAIAAATVLAAQSQQKVDLGFQSFLGGEIEQLSLDEQGILRPAPEFALHASVEGPVIWNAVGGPDGTLYLGTGNQGVVIAVSPEGEVIEVFRSGAVLVRALAVGPDGALYVGTSPNGMVYRLARSADGAWKNAEVYYDPAEIYVWDLAFDDEGNLFVATGQGARIYKLPAGFQMGEDEAVEYYRSSETHFNSLAFDPDGNLLASSGSRGRIYRITDRGEAFVLYQSGVPEIRALLPMADGSILFSTFDSPGNRRSRPPERGAGDQENKEGNGNGNRPAEVWQPNPFSPSGSQILRLSAEGFAEVLWELPDVQIFSLAAKGDGSLLVGSGTDGRIYEVRDAQDWELLTQLPTGGEVTAFWAGSGARYAFSSNPSRIYRQTNEPVGGGSYTSAVADATQIVTWGRLDAREHSGSAIGSGLRVETRSGNTSVPDDTWSPFMELQEDGKIGSPAARFLQYRVTWPDSAGAGDTLRAVRLFYRLANQAPRIRGINLVPLGFEVVAGNTPRRNFDLNQLTDAGDLRPFFSSPPVRQQLVVDREEAALTAGWSATDPNGDRLRFRVEMRGPGGPDWVMIADDLADPVYSMSVNGLPEGHYQLKVTASDHLDNPPGAGRSTSRVSEPFLIDLTPPEIEISHRSEGSDRHRFEIRVSDSLGVITAMRYRLNGSAPRRLLPDDGIHDQLEEQFTLILENLESGWHSIVFEAVDENRNEAVRQLRFEAP